MWDWEGRPLLTTSCCEWTTLQQGDQGDQGADILEFIYRIGLLYFMGFTMLPSELENKLPFLLGEIYSLRFGDLCTCSLARRLSLPGFLLLPCTFGIKQSVD